MRRAGTASTLRDWAARSGPRPTRPRRAQPARRGDFAVRVASPADLAAVADVLAAAYAEFSQHMHAELFEPYVADLLDLETRSQVADLLVATVDGRVAGTVSYYPDAGVQGLGWPSGWAGLRALAVSPKARGLGVGRALVAECVRRGRAQHAPVVSLHTADFMTAAIRVYERLGFRRAGLFDVDVAVRPGAPAGRTLRILGYLKPVHPLVEEPAAELA